MISTQKIVEMIESGELDSIISQLYGESTAIIDSQRTRYIQAVCEFENIYGRDRMVSIYSVPGRTEMAGNHTDHNNGLVLAAAVDLDIVAIISPNNDNTIRVQSEGFATMDVVKLDDISVQASEKGHASSLLRGVAAGFTQMKGQVHGFDAYTTSNVLKGSGLSSSAAFEICLGNVLNGEFNGNRFTPIQLALIAQYAENKYYGKPSGLMDQAACSVGGVVQFDFEKSNNPDIKRIRFDLSKHHLSLVITDTGGDHSGMDEEYASIRSDMGKVASQYGAKVLREVKEETVLAQIPSLRASVGDRAVLRALHYFAENRRVKAMAKAIVEGDAKHFLCTVTACGHSSFEYNQNAYSLSNLDQQGIPLALAVSQAVIGDDGAWRLQGGGFAGTIQAYVPASKVEVYVKQMRTVFGPGACHIVQFRNIGGTKVL